MLKLATDEPLSAGIRTMEIKIDKSGCYGVIKGQFVALKLFRGYAVCSTAGVMGVNKGRIGQRELVGAAFCVYVYGWNQVRCPQNSTGYDASRADRYTENKSPIPVTSFCHGETG
jgi:hypothetical protein